MKQIINGVTYNTETSKLLKETVFKDGNGGRRLYIGMRGKSRGSYYVYVWKHPHYTGVAINPISREDIKCYIWENDYSPALQ